MTRRFFSWLRIALVVLVLLASYYVVNGVHSVRETANRMTCAGKLKQLGLATMMYAQDYDEMLFTQPFPGCYTDPNTSVTTYAYYYPDLLYPYVKSVPLFKEPDFEGYPFWPYTCFVGAPGAPANLQQKHLRLPALSS